MRVVRWIGRHLDPLLALGLLGTMAVEAWLVVPPASDDLPVPPSAAATALAGITAFALAASLAGRRRTPLAVLLLAIVASATATSEPLAGPVSVIVAIAIAAYTAGAETSGRSAVVAGVGIALLVGVTAARPATSIEEPADAASLAMLIVGPWLAGIAIRARREREALLAQRAAELERDREARAAAAVAEERARIARELHDVVAHAISVIVLQARGARRAIGHDAGAAREAIDTIEATGSEALAEMRRLIGMIREPDDVAALAPQPGLAGLETLVGLVRDAGLPVEVRIEGDPVGLPAGIDLAAYRIVQEALTNALTHADAGRAAVTIRYGPSSLELEIVDTGAGRAPVSTDGHGLIGMRERVSLYGGRLDAGPRPEGGFAVRAQLPFGAGA